MKSEDEVMAMRLEDDEREHKEVGLTLSGSARRGQMRY